MDKIYLGCVKCNRLLDRHGSLCSTCMSERQDEIDMADQQKPLDAWEFLDKQFTHIFGSRK